ncbi:MAG: hypothetical protein IJO33_02960 [Bacilli bacterium]|nr:hypothetical protein [Bacilli bacterium]
MNYYYDIILNFNKEGKPYYNFYEWEKDDDLVKIKKIPIFRIEEKTLLNLFEYEGKLESDWVSNLKDKTTFKIENKIKTISYACIFTDTKSCIALNFSQDGTIIGKSLLLLEDELNLLEIGYSLKKEKIVFTRGVKSKNKNDLRQEELIKLVIKKELEKAYKEKNDNKLIYYHLEWFNSLNKDIEKIYHKMQDDLKNDLTDNVLKIYYLVRLSYNKI